MDLYRINNWSAVFENNRTREIKNLAFVCVPNKQDGDGYTDLLDHPNGPAHYGAWMAILLAASKCGERGTLLRDTKIPHCTRSLARITRMPAKLLDEVLPRLVAMGWLTREPYDVQQDTTTPQEGAGIPQASADDAAPSCLEQDRTGLDGTGLNRTEQKGARKRASFVVEDVQFPSELDTPEARTAAADWIDHKRAMRKPYATAKSFGMLLDEWARAGPDAFVEAVRHSIAQNYQGVYAPKDNNHANRNQPGAGQQYVPGRPLGPV